MDHFIWFTISLMSMLMSVLWTLNVIIKEVTKLLNSTQEMLKSLKQLIKEFHF